MVLLYYEYDTDTPTVVLAIRVRYNYETVAGNMRCLRSRPKNDKWINSSPFHLSLFFTVYLLFKCRFVA